MEFNDPIASVLDGHYWGPATSTIDWCEENYVMCTYIAEFWNTTTNVVFFALAAFGMYQVRATKQESRFLLCYIAMMVVGLGSWLFHMTLQYQWQLADELPMVYGTCICIYCALQADAKVGTNIYVSLGLFGYSAVVTLVYVQIRKPVFHQVAYGLEVLIILIRNMIHQMEIRKTNLGAYTEMMQLYQLGVGSFGLAFVLWNIDNIFCTEIRALRNALPVVLAPLFQLHAYWHIGTALGCYVSIVYQQYLRLVKLDKIDQFYLRKMAFVVPYIDRRAKAE
ncbi:Alkaline ceramidase 3 [Coemansia sp. RSA 988]|nr:Alkaline ceramidase 3 [Coemansia sp. RSA 988]